MKTYNINISEKSITIDTDDPSVSPKGFNFNELGLMEFDDIDDLQDQINGEDRPGDTIEEKSRLPFFEKGDEIRFFLEINEDTLRETIRKELRNALDFDWSGWRIPIYIDIPSGEITTGGWLSQGSYDPVAYEFYSISPWSIDFEEYCDEGMTPDDMTEEEKEDTIRHEIDLAEEFHISRIKNEIIRYANEEARMHNTEAGWKADFEIELV
jgi:hypothetical protein